MKVPKKAATPPAAAATLRRLLGPIDRFFDRVFGSAYNPLYQSGNLAVLFLAVAVVTGVYLFLFYQIGEAHASVVRIEEEVFLGSFMRSLHRYSADLALVALGVHMLRKLVQGHTWGPRALAWRSGILLLFVVLLCGWTGLIMVWDRQALQLAVVGAELIDLLPLFSEPIGRSFSGEVDIPSSFFFMNLFLHVALPLGVAAGLWLHVARVARPAVVPSQPMRRFALVSLGLFSLLVPVALPPAADLLELPTRMPVDLFYSGWLVPAQHLPSWAVLLFWLLFFGVLWQAPVWWRPRDAEIEPSFVDENRCTGCYQCYQDCPYEAITMVEREVPSSLSELVARVDPAVCVGCGICAGSCASMGVGPPGRVGREQLTAVKGLSGEVSVGPDQVVLLSCAFGLGLPDELAQKDGVVAFESGCSGSVHTSAIEGLLRSGAGGVYLLSCPGRDCLFREGPKWLEQRIYHDREAELQARVDRRRVRLGSFSRSEATLAHRDLDDFVAAVRELQLGTAEPTDPEDPLCKSQLRRAAAEPGTDDREQEPVGVG